MDEAKAWLEIEKILSDTDGKYWDNIRGRLQKPVDVLSKNLSLEKFKTYIQKISDCKSNEKVFYYSFGFGVLSNVLEKLANESWAEQGYSFLLEEFSKVEKENDRAIALVGNYYWPGVVENFPREARVLWIEKLYNRSLGIIDGIRDQSMMATAISRVTQDMHKIGQVPWIQPFFESLVQRSFLLKEAKDQAEALSGIIHNLGEWPEALWAVEMIENLLNRSDEFSERPPDMWEDSPRTSFLKGIIRSIGEAGDAPWVRKTTEKLWAKIDTISNEQEKSKLFENLAEAGLQSESNELKEKISSKMFGEISAMKDQDARAEAIGKMASGLAEGKEQKELPEIFDRLIKLAKKIKSEEARAEALSGAAYSVAVALAKLSEQEWARARLESLQRMARTFRSQEYRAEFLGGLTEALEESPNAEWAGGYCRRIVKVARTIRGEEARSTALESIARGVGQLEGVSWCQSLMRDILDVAKKIRDENERAMALCGICEEVASASSDPWVAALALDVLAYIDEETEVPRAFGLQHLGSDVLPKIQAVKASEQVATAMVNRVFSLDNNTLRAMALAGVVEGLQKMSHAKLKRELLFSVAQRIEEIQHDEDRALAIVGFVHGVGEIGSEIHKESWAQELFIQLMRVANDIKDDLLKLGVIGGGPLDLGADFTSIAVALGHIANADWGDVYRGCVSFAGGLTTPIAWLTAYNQILEHGFGDLTLKEELKEATWLRSIYLNCLKEIGEGLVKSGAELEDSDRTSLKESIAQKMHFLRTRLDAQEIAEHQEMSDRCELYNRLLDSASAFSEDIHTEKDVFTGDIRYTITPREALLETLSTDFVLEDPKWAMEFLRRLLEAVRSLRNQTAREMVYQVMAESFFLSPDEVFVRECSDQLLTSTQSDSNVHPVVSIALVRAYVGRGLKDSALEIALTIGEPSTRLQALRELALVFREEVPRALRETLEQFVDVEERIAILDGRLHDPEYKDDNPDKYPYDVAISFAGPDREHAEQLHRALLDNNLRVFYYPDPARQAELWGEDGYRKLYEVFNSQALYCLILISQHYIERKWTMHELRAAQARQLESKEAYILQVKLDETELPGEAPTRIYVDLRERGYEKVAAMLAARVLKNRLKRP